MDQERSRKPEQVQSKKPDQESVPGLDGESAGMVCGTCGRTPEDEGSARLTWALGVEAGRQVWTCERCSRLHLRSIEGKLDSQWWS
jgi:hypothetical protein